MAGENGQTGAGANADEAAPPSASRRRMATVFGWIAGGSFGLLVSYTLFLLVGETWPVVPTTFVLFLLGAFGGMALSDRLGARAFRVLGISAGVLFAIALTLVLAVAMSTR